MPLTKKPELLMGLQQRVSFPRLTDPAPSSEELAECYKAAFRTPDHGWLRPWRFIECRGQERNQLGELVEQAIISEQPDIDDSKRKKFREGPLRAPLVIIAYAVDVEHPVVPASDQLAAANGAVHNLLTALYAQGFGSVWRTGLPAQSKAVHKALGLSNNETITGFLYVGTPLNEAKEVPTLVQADYVSTFNEYAYNRGL